MKTLNPLKIREKKEYTTGDLDLSHLSDVNKCHFMISSYGEVTSASLNKTEVKRVIKWLEKWVNYMEEGEEE